MIDNKFEQIINMPLSVYLIKKLMEISETVGMLRGALQQSDCSALFYDILHIKELFQAMGRNKQEEDRSLAAR